MTLLLEEELGCEYGSGGVWDYVSASRLSLWLHCPLAFKLRYIDGIRLPTSPSQFIGKQVHAGLELWHRQRQIGRPLTIPELVASAASGWDDAVETESVTFDSAEDEQVARQQVSSLLTTYLSGVGASDPMPLAVETHLATPLIDPFSGENLGLPLVGVLDLVLPSRNGPLVVDYKTSGRSAPPLEILHEVQLSSYSYLLREATGQVESSLEIRSLIKTKTPKVEIHAFEARQERHFRRLFAVLREYLDALDRGRFNYRPGWGCTFCNLRASHCPQWDG